MPKSNPTPHEFAQLPKFLVADDGGERDFVIHCHYPRFIMEYVDTQGVPLFLDDEAGFIQRELAAGREPAVAMARLMRQAGEFFMAQISH